MEDLSILQAFRRKDISGCSLAFQKYYKPLCMYAYAFLQDNTKAEDAVQDAFVSLCSKKDLWPKILDVRSYLYKTVSNRCKSILKSELASERHETAFSSTYESKSSDQSFVPESSGELHERVKNAISLLSPQRRKVITLVYFEGVSYIEAASRLGVSKNTIKTHLKLGRSELKGTIKLIFLIAIFSTLI